MAGWNQCNQCGYEWQGRGQKAPVACPRCKRYDWPQAKKERINGNPRRADHEHNRVDNRREQIGRSLDGLAVSFLRPSEEVTVGLHPLPAVRDELDGGDGPDAEPEREGCSYREYDPDTGETYGCALTAHGPKVKHVRGAKV